MSEAIDTARKLEMPYYTADKIDDGKPELNQNEAMLLLHRSLPPDRAAPGALQILEKEIEVRKIVRP